MLLARNPRFSGDRLSADYFETDFASFLAWRDWGFPDKDVFNGFGMGALRASDGAFVLGEMAGHTANAGRIYFPSGTPDLDDIRDGTMDIAGSVAREVEEETGLTPRGLSRRARLELRRHRRLARDDPDARCRSARRCACARRSRPILRGRISAELSAIHLVRRRSDLTGAMPRFVTAFLEAELPA